MKCFNCSSPITESEKFCGRCGAAQGFSAELIARGIAGDQTALTELYNKTYDNVYYTVKALIRDEDAALDIMQDSYLKAFRNLSTLKEADGFRAWIKRIAHNTAIDHLRRKKPVMFSAMTIDDDGDEVEFEDTNTANLPEVVIDRRETARLMAEILDTLPEEQRLVISMYYYEGMSIKEIAGELGITENTVKSRMNYGRKKIEAQVLDLEKKGTKLYGLAPIPFLNLLLRCWTGYSAGSSPSLLSGILSKLPAGSSVLAQVANTASGQSVLSTHTTPAAAQNTFNSATPAQSANQTASTMAYNANQTASTMRYHANQTTSAIGQNVGKTAFAKHGLKGGIKGAFAAFKASLPAKIVAGVLAVSITAGVAVPNIINSSRKADTEVKDVFKDYIGNPSYICLDLSALPDEITLQGVGGEMHKRNSATTSDGYNPLDRHYVGGSGQSLGGNCFVEGAPSEYDLQEYEVTISFWGYPLENNGISYSTIPLVVTPDRLGGLIVADGTYTTQTDEYGNTTRICSVHWQDVSGAAPAKTPSAAEETEAPTQAPTTARWAQLYTDYLNQFREDTIDTSGFSFADLSELDGVEARHYDYTLVYLDNDDVPELLISPYVGSGPIGTIVCWVYNDRLCTQNTYYVSTSETYENVFYGYGCSAAGHYETHQYTISGDTLTDTKVGEYIPGTYQPNGDNQKDLYYWNAEPVDYDSYIANYGEIIGNCPAISYPYEQKDDIISEIQRMSSDY